MSMLRGRRSSWGSTPWHPDHSCPVLLVTNDFPPKVGGIQSYLWELWRRLPAADTVVYCTPHDGAAAFDAAEKFRIERSPEPVLLPHPWLANRIRKFGDDVGAELTMLDPAVPLGVIGPFLERPYGVVLHGAEVTIPGRLPGARHALGRVLRGASLVVSAGEYALAEAERCAGTELPAVVIPPGVDTTRFQPYDQQQRAEVRSRFGLGADDFVVSSVNRLVPRKGMHILVEAAARMARSHPNLRVLIGGSGRAESELAKQIDSLVAPVRLLGRIPDEDVEALYGASDVMAMLCHDRWWGLEQEGFGIVFLEAAAAGIPQLAGRSGGAAEAVEHGVTGLVVDEPTNVDQVVNAIETLIAAPDFRSDLGRAARLRVEARFDYDVLASQLGAALRNWRSFSEPGTQTL